MHEASDSVRPEPAPTVEALQAALERERERARQVDHRARNSLQLVSSLLLLTSRRSAEPETQRTLKAMHQRIGALAAVHRDIMAGEHPDRFDLAQFISEHASHLARAQEGDVQLDLAPLEVSGGQACAYALIVNELVLNALSHGAGTTVKVGLDDAEGGPRIVVEDAGPGLDPDAIGPGFGMTIVKLLVQQIGATLDLQDAHPGLRAIVAARGR